jgi:urease accessory protein
MTVEPGSDGRAAESPTGAVAGFAPESRAGSRPGQLPGFLSVLQLSDSAFPSGRYTLSHGLEAMTQGGLLTTPSAPAELVELLTDQIRAGVAPSDGVALACAHRAAHTADAGNAGDAADRGAAPVDLETVRDADARLTAVKLGREAREASTRTGRALLSIAVPAIGTEPVLRLAELVDSGRTPGNHAVVLGVIGATVGVPRLEAVAGELYAFAVSWVSAAVRLSVTDHRTAQTVLHRARPSLAEAALGAVDRDVTHISGCTPLLDLMSMRHEEAELRLFAN